MDMNSRHETANLRMENSALRRQLERTADQLDRVTESNCAEEDVAESERMSKRAHRMARL